MRATPAQYAAALRMTCGDAETALRIGTELRAIAQGITDDPAIRAFATDIRIPIPRAIAALRSAAARLDPRTVGFCALLLTQRALASLPAILSAYEALPASQSTATLVVDAAGSGPTAQRALTRLLTTQFGNDAAVTFADAPHMMAGYRITANGAQSWDATLREHLRQLAVHLAQPAS